MEMPEDVKRADPLPVIAAGVWSRASAVRADLRLKRKVPAEVDSAGTAYALTGFR